jgi:hypothetical protein
MRHTTRGLAGLLATMLSLALVLPVAATEPPSTQGLVCDIKVSTIDSNGVEGAQQDTSATLERFQNFNVYGTGLPANTMISLHFDMPNVAGSRTFNVSTDGTGAFVEQFFAYPVYEDQPQPNLWQLSLSSTPPGCADTIQIQVWNYVGVRYFTDTDGHLFEDHIDWLFMNAIAKGCATRVYCPEAVVTREQMASFLVRALGLPATSTDFFTDDESSIHEADINALAASGITTGCTATLFCPSQPVARQEMASFLVRGFDLPANSTDFFTDDESSVHEADINALAATGITTGCGGGRFCPTAGVTRGQMAAFLMRAIHGPGYFAGLYGPALR